AVEVDNYNHYLQDVFPFSEQVCDWDEAVIDEMTGRKIPRCKIIRKGYFGNSMQRSNAKKVILNHLALLKSRKIQQYEKYQFVGLTKELCQELYSKYGITLEELKLL